MTVFAEVLAHIATKYAPIQDELRELDGLQTSWAEMHCWRFARAVDLTARYAPDRDLVMDIGPFPEQSCGCARRYWATNGLWVLACTSTRSFALR